MQVVVEHALYGRPALSRWLVSSMLGGICAQQVVHREPPGTMVRDQVGVEQLAQRLAGIWR